MPDRTPAADIDLTARLRALEDRVAALERQPSAALSCHDREALARLLPAIVGRLGSEEFCSRDLLVDSSPALRLVLHGRSVKSIGRLLRRAAAAATPVSGYLVEDRGRELSVVVWRVVEAIGRFPEV